MARSAGSLAVAAVLLALCATHSTTASLTNSHARRSVQGVADLVDGQVGLRNLLAKESVPAPAPAPGNSTFRSTVANAPGPHGVTSFVSSTSAGTAVNATNNITGHINTSGKTLARGYQCVQFDAGMTITCMAKDRPVPACCSSQRANATCNTWDNGGLVSCSSADTPYPSCCEDRNQPVSLCTAPISGSCPSSDTPVPGCCGTGSCTVNKDGSGGVCPTAYPLRCCPS